MRRDDPVLPVLLLAVCLLLSTRLIGQDPPLTPEQKEKLKHRDELARCLRELSEQKKWDEYVATLEKLVRLEQEALTPAHPRAIASLKRLADAQERLQQWEGAIKTRKEVVGLEEQRLG